jgi:hypothetical protein
LAAVAAVWLLAFALCDLALAGDERYFIDFRSRPSSYIGHTYVVYFRVDPGGRVTEYHYAGLIPEQDVWDGIFGPIRASVRRYKDDTRFAPNALYRRQLTAAEYRRVSRVVQKLRTSQRRWHVVFFNCNDFAIEVAEALDMRRPPSLLPPSVWVTMLRKFNEPGS